MHTKYFAIFIAFVTIFALILAPLAVAQDDEGGDGEAEGVTAALIIQGGGHRLLRVFAVCQGEFTRFEPVIGAIPAKLKGVLWIQIPIVILLQVKIPDPGNPVDLIAEEFLAELREGNQPDVEEFVAEDGSAAEGGVEAVGGDGRVDGDHHGGL